MSIPIKEKYHLFSASTVWMIEGSLIKGRQDAGFFVFAENMQIGREADHPSTVYHLTKSKEAAMKQKFIPKEKLSKKSRRALNAKQRRTWDQPPITKVIPNKKKISQMKSPRPGREDAGWGDFHILCGSSIRINKMEKKFRIFG